ncbi:hypothetical protein ZIOFF_027229 [Zingiber officinale]|uniref:Uncharacterized protein n=1 Tax=Zingiber officinale TaxID=94328 RepID=A0A8J5HHS6_ZINOF|nr:hypothetical protein ZIOFF_027229 [Zingiber officinale]
MNGMKAVKSAALGGYRSIGLFAGRAAVAAGLRASYPAIATVSVEGGPSMSICSLDKGSQEASPVSAVQKPWWEEEQEVVPLESLDPAPRLVFGPVPTLEEAKEATSDLVDTLKDQATIIEASFIPLISDTNCRMYPSLILSHSSTEVPHASFMFEAPVVVPSTPRHVAQAFALLQGNPQVQSVVASIAADKNVWAAVMNNPDVTEFYETHKSIVYPPESSCFVTEVPMADEDHKSSTTKPTKISQFMNLIHRAKDKMVEVVINISTFMQDFLDPKKAGNEQDKSFFNSSFGSSLMALAIATILVILFKRA